VTNWLTRFAAHTPLERARDIAFSKRLKAIMTSTEGFKDDMDDDVASFERQRRELEFVREANAALVEALMMARRQIVLWLDQTHREPTLLFAQIDAALAKAHGKGEVK
jgi:copper oxidase (laccase) domain-containing protein